MDSDHPTEMWNKLREREKLNRIPRHKADPWNYYPYVKSAIKSIALADKVIVFSDHAEKTFIDNGVDKKKITKLRPPLSREIPLSLTKKFPETPEFIFVSNHPIRKGLDVCLKSWEYYKQHGGIGILYILGNETHSLKYLQKRFGHLRDIIYVGSANYADFLNVCRVLIYPSFSEGRPRTVLESLSAGNPVITSGQASADLVENGKNGWLVKPDPVSVFEALLETQRQWIYIKNISQEAQSVMYKMQKEEYYQGVYKLIKEFKK